MKFVPSLFTRYLSKNFLLAFLGTLLVLLALILLFDIIDLLRRAASRDYVTFWDIVRLGLLKLPQMVPIILPFSILIASLINFHYLSKTRELVVARSAGLSVWNFLLPLVFVVMMLGFLNVSIFNPFSAAMLKRYELAESVRFKKNLSFSWTSKGLWLREKQGENIIVVRADGVRQSHKDLVLSRVSLIILNPDETFLKQIEAPSGILKGNVLSVYQGISFNEEGEKGHVDFFHLPTELDLKKLMQTFEDPEKIPVWELPSFIRVLDNSGFSSIRHRVHLYSLWTSILSFMAMVLIAAMFSLSPNQRQGRVLLKICGAILFGFILFFLSKLTTALGLSGALPVWLATIGPSIVMICIALSVLLHSEDG